MQGGGQLLRIRGTLVRQPRLLLLCRVEGGRRVTGLARHLLPQAAVVHHASVDATGRHGRATTVAADAVTVA